MSLTDIISVFQWWVVFFAIGIIFLPITTTIFSNFFDKGYIFSKILGIAILSYAVFLLGTIKIFPFTQLTIIFTLGVLFLFNVFIFKKTSLFKKVKENLAIFVLEEIIFAAALFFWSYIRSFQPDIHGLEKFMDFGFVNSILRSDFFPPKDMWLTPFPINYYYFGHLVTAVLTKLSNIPSSITYNLMLSTIFAFTFTASFSLGANLISMFTSEEPIRLPRRWRLTTPPRWIACGLLTAFLVSFAGNLHAIYSFFLPYQNGNPVPFWQLVFSPSTFPNAYWYPNATRFIYNTIHEFPIYSFVVSDLHGHVLDIPFVFLIIALLFSLISKSEILNPKQIQNSKLKKFSRFAICDLRFAILLGFILAVMYMTNVWDGAIYFLLTIFVLIYLFLKKSSAISQTKSSIYYLLFTIFAIGLGLSLFSLPFSINFKPFVSGIGVLCAPQFLTDLGKIGPFLFESNHCQRSPSWQLLILYGFFYFWIALFVFKIFDFGHWKLFRNCPAACGIPLRREKLEIRNLKTSDIFVLLLILLSTSLIFLPEFIYIKDIYPAHYRANTMFKLVYQAFIMLSIASGYIIIRIITNVKLYHWRFVVLVFIGIIGLFPVGIYPYFAINSYYGNLQNYKGLDGVKYLNNLYPNDYQAILWINKNIKGQPIILEAQGDSYTDFARVSANTGLPTVLGWTVHEWLWRGTYDIPAPRIEEVKTVYETKDLETAQKLINKYQISLVFIGDLERQKYPNLNEDKFQNLGKIIYQNGQTKIYKLGF